MGAGRISLGWLVGLGAALSGCVVADDDDNGRLGYLSVDLYWEEPRGGGRFGGGDQYCETAGVDFMAFRLLDARGELVDCYPRADDGACVSDPRDCVDGDCLDRPACLNFIDFELDPGDYRLLVDGYREGCAEAGWQFDCFGLYMDRFDEQYACSVRFSDGTGDALSKCGDDELDGSDSASDAGM